MSRSSTGERLVSRTLTAVLDGLGISSITLSATLVEKFLRVSKDNELLNVELVIGFTCQEGEIHHCRSPQVQGTYEVDSDLGSVGNCRHPEPEGDQM